MTKEELEITAFQARVEVKEEEKEKYLKELNSMAKSVEILQKPDVSNLKPTTHVTGLRNVWREDIVRPCPKETIESMLNAAPEREGSFYKIQKVIEAE